MNICYTLGLTSTQYIWQWKILLSNCFLLEDIRSYQKKITTLWRFIFLLLAAQAKTLESSLISFLFFSSTRNYWQLWQPWSNKVTVQLFTTIATACLGQASHSWPSIAVTKTMIKSGVGREGSMWLTSHSPSLREAETMEDLLTGLLSGLAQTAFLYKAEPPAPEQLYPQCAVPSPSIIIRKILP